MLLTSRVTLLTCSKNIRLPRKIALSPYFCFTEKNEHRNTELRTKNMYGQALAKKTKIRLEICMFS